MGFINNKVKDLVKNWLEIQPNPGNSIVIRETNTFESACFRNLLWYRGDASELHQYYTQTDDFMNNTKFWAAVATQGVNFRKIHTGLPAIMIDMLADITVDSFNEITVSNNTQAQKDWEKIAKENDFKELLKQAIIDVLIKGDGAFKISYDTEMSKFPIIEFYSGEDVDFEYTRGRITATLFKNKYIKDDGTYELQERYTKDGINNKLYKNGNPEDQYGTIPETKDLKEPNEVNFLLSVPVMFNKSKKWKGRGQNILEKKLDAFDSLDEVWSQWIEAIRDNKTETFIPEDLLPVDDKGNLLAPNTFDRRFTKVQDSNNETKSDKITRCNSDFDYDGMLQSYITALDLCLQGIISPSTLGIDVKKLDNADAQREKEKTTQYSRGKILDKLEKVIPELVNVCLKAYDKAQRKTPGEYEVNVDFREYANPSFEAVVETVSKARPGQNIMSVEKAVDTMYGDSLSASEKAKEVKKLKEESGIMITDEPSVVI